MLKHVVLAKFKAGVTADEIARLKKSLAADVSAEVAASPSDSCTCSQARSDSPSVSSCM